MNYITIEATVAVFNPERIPRDALSRTIEKMPLIDHPDNAWGILLECEGTFGDVNEAVAAVMGNLQPLLPYVVGSRTMIRLAVYNPNFTFTTVFKPNVELAQSGIELEISVYPESD